MMRFLGFFVLVLASQAAVLLTGGTLEGSRFCAILTAVCIIFIEVERKDA